MIDYQTELQDTLQEIVESPKLMAAVGTSTSGLGVATISDWISGPLALGACIAGLVATILLGRVHWQNLCNQKLKTKILKKQLRDLGIDPDFDE